MKSIYKNINKFFSLEISSGRIYGLDIVRTVAILIVMFLHSSVYMKVDYSVHLPGGVYLFFILSGFLIGTILINLFEEQNNNFRSLLKDFWYRRWIRTWPLYYILLIFYIILSYLYGEGSFLDKIKYFLFLQNVVSTKYGFFGQSWSLTIEEWFYIFIPFIFLLFYNKLKLKNYIPFFLIIFTILGLWIRFYFFNHSKLINNNVLNTFMPTNFYVPALGVLIAYVYRKYKDYIYKNRFWFLVFPLVRWYIAKFPIATSILILLILFYPSNFKSIKTSHWTSPVIILVTLKISFFNNMIHQISNMGVDICLISFFLFFVTIKNGRGLLHKFITYTSLISYSLYLTHGHFVQDYILEMPVFGWLPSCYVNNVKLLFFWVLSYFVGFLCYKYIELPFLKIRDKKLGGNKSTQNFKSFF